jgi:RNA ligase (TIGR02306 family)
MRELVKIVTVKDLTPIEGADRIVLATMNENGWKCIVSKNEFNPGDIGLFFEVDSVLPETDTRFAFMLPRKMRIKSMRMKGVLSQGLLMPISMFPEVNWDTWNNSSTTEDLGTFLGVKLYEPPVDNSTGPQFQNGTKRESNFPNFIPKTDQERIQNVPNMLFDLLNEGMMFHITEKLDGTSCTIFKYEGKIGVCSRNFIVEDSPECQYWRVAKEQDWLNVLEHFDNIALQGEIIGPKIQGNKYKLETPTFYLFDIFNIRTQKYFNPEEFREFTKLLRVFNIHNIKCVPQRHWLTLDYLRANNITDLDTLLAHVEQLCAKSFINNEVIAEGIVIRSVDNVNYQSKKLSFNDEVAHCKIINNNFLLRHGE